jgi:hypothetical protein
MPDCVAAGQFCRLNVHEPNLRINHTCGLVDLAHDATREQRGERSHQKSKCTRSIPTRTGPRSWL